MTEATTTTAATGDTTTATTTAAPAWHGMTTPEDVAWVGTKGWKAPADVINSYRGAEKLIGRDPSTLIPLPRADDPEGYRSVKARLGMPEAPDKYELAAGPGGAKLDETYEKWARDTFHKVGLTAQEVKALTTAQTEFAASQHAKAETEYNTRLTLDKQTLLTEWGGGHERMMNAAETAAKSLGFTEEMIDAMERSTGYAATMKFFASLGQKLGEDKFVTGGTGGKFQGTLTVDEAKAQWEAMKLDPTSMAALKDAQHPAHKAQTAKKNGLFKLMFPE